MPNLNKGRFIIILGNKKVFASKVGYPGSALHKACWLRSSACFLSVINCALVRWSSRTERLQVRKAYIFHTSSVTDANFKMLTQRESLLSLTNQYQTLEQSREV